MYRRCARLVFSDVESLKTNDRSLAAGFAGAAFTARPLMRPFAKAARLKAWLRTVKNYEQGVLPRRLMLAAQAVTLITLLPVWATYPSARLLQVLEQLVNIEVK